MIECSPSLEDVKDFCKNLNIELSPESNNQLVSIFKKFKVERNEQILKPGHVCHYIYYVLSGCVREYYYKGDKDISKFFAFEGNRSFFAESFINQSRSKVGSMALEPTILLGLSHDGLLESCKSNQEIEWLYRTCLERALLTAQKKSFLFQFGNAYERYNNLLKEKPEVIKRISSNYISSYLNVTPETLSRIKSKR